MTPDDVGFSAEPQGQGTDDEGWKHYLWRVTLTVDGHTLTTDYRMGEAHVDARRCGDHAHPKPGERLAYNHFGPGTAAMLTPRAPTAKEVLNSLALDADCGDQSFHDFCMDLGYDEDSRKAYATYEACRDQMYELKRLFGARYNDFTGTEWDT